MVPRKVRVRVVGGGTGINHELAGFDQGSDAGHGSRCGGETPPSSRGPLLVQLLERRKGTAGAPVVPPAPCRDELSLVINLKRPVRAPLVTQRALRRRADAFSAQRAGAVSGPDLQVVRVRPQPVQALE